MSCTIIEGKIETDLYRKETDRNQYLLPSSCHPKQTTKSIPVSLGLRIVRNCSRIEQRNQRLGELKGQLLDRGYNSEMVDTALEKVKLIPREKALKKKKKSNKSQRPVFAVHYDPRLPSINSTFLKHWRSMTSLDSHLEKVFKEPPLVAFKRQQNIRNHIIRAKVPPTIAYPKRYQKGMKKCGKSCTGCPYIKEGRKLILKGQEWFINRQLNCNSYNVIYAIMCKKENCQQIYIGEPKECLSTA